MSDSSSAETPEQGMHLGKMWLVLCPVDGAKVWFHHFLTCPRCGPHVRMLDDSHSGHFPGRLVLGDVAWPRTLS